LSDVTLGATKLITRKRRAALEGRKIRQGWSNVKAFTRQEKGSFRAKEFLDTRRGGG